MTRSHSAVSAVLASLALIACSPRPADIRSEAAYRALKDVQAAVQVGVTKPAYENVLERAAAEVLILKQTAHGGVDSSALTHYSAAMQIYVDAERLWNEEVKTAGYDWMPAGEIYIEPDMTTMIGHYGFQQLSRQLKGKGGYVTIAGSAIGVLWTKADSAIALGDAIVVPHFSVKR